MKLAPNDGISTVVFRNVSWHFAGSILDISNCGILTSLEISIGRSFFHLNISSLVVLETGIKEVSNLKTTKYINNLPMH